MDVFDLRRQIIGDYSTYASSFIKIRDTRISNKVQQNISEGTFWPHPLIQLNPRFEDGGTIEKACKEGLLHAECAQIFMRNKAQGGRSLHLHRHQREAIEIAKRGYNYLLTTGYGLRKKSSLHHSNCQSCSTKRFR
jgi:ATP-dependent helicase YprA (DUF1998 family)